MKNIRWLAVVAALIIVAPSLADARAGGGTGAGAGSRGTRTYQAPAPTQTAPAPKPVERTVTPQQAPNPAAAAPAAPLQRTGFMARNPFFSGLMGGMLGAGLFGMFFGGGFFGGLGGGAGMLGLVLQLLLIGGLAYLAVRLLRGRIAARAQLAGPAAGYSAATPRLSSGPVLVGGASLASGASPQLAVTADDYHTFEGLLTEIQTAYSQGDLARLRGLATPEMLGYFAEELSANASRGVENKVEAVKLEQGDLSEAWSEADFDYATVAMRFSMIDVTRRIGDGTIVAGSDQTRGEATEVWTFLRNRGGKWILSAIQQA